MAQQRTPLTKHQSSRQLALARLSLHDEAAPVTMARSDSRLEAVPPLLLNNRTRFFITSDRQAQSNGSHLQPTPHPPLACNPTFNTPHTRERAGWTPRTLATWPSPSTRAWCATWLQAGHAARSLTGPMRCLSSSSGRTHVCSWCRTGRPGLPWSWRQSLEQGANMGRGRLPRPPCC